MVEHMIRILDISPPKNLKAFNGFLMKDASNLWPSHSSHRIWENILNTANPPSQDWQDIARRHYQKLISRRLNSICSTHHINRGFIQNLVSKSLDWVQKNHESLSLPLTLSQFHWRSRFKAELPINNSLESQNLVATDGSFDPATNKQGAAVVDQKGNCLKFKVEGYNSINVAESAAILMAIHATSNWETVNILTDSQICITMWNKHVIEDQPFKAKSPAKSIWNEIKLLVGPNWHRISLIKVKAHTQSLSIRASLNKIADQAAKEACHSGWPFSTPSETLSPLSSKSRNTFLMEMSLH